MSRLTIVMIIVLSILTAGCGGAESRKAKYLESGNNNYSQDDCKKAKLDYRNVLQIDPKHVGAMVGLAKCHIDEKEWRKAYQLLLAGNETDNSSIDAKIELTKLYLLTGDNEKVYQLIEEILVLDPDNPSAIALRGFFHLGNSSVAAARSDANQSHALDKYNLSAVTLLTALDIKDEKQSESIARIKSILSISQLSKRYTKELKLILIGLYNQLGQMDNIASVLNELIIEFPDTPEYTYRLASVYANNNEIDKADAILLSLIDTQDNKNKNISAYISFLDKYRSTEQATKSLEEFVSANKSNENLKMSLAKRYLESNPDKAVTIYKELADSNTGSSPSLESKNELAFLSLKENNVSEAERLINSVLEEQPTNLRALMIRGTLALSKRDAPQAISDYRTILRDQPRNELIIRQLASAYILNGQDELAKELLQSAISQNSDNKDIGLLYARLQGKDNEFDSAIETINDILKTDDNDLETVKTLFDLQIANNDFESAKQTAESMKLSSEDSPLGYYLSGLLLQNDKNYDQAEKEYLLALEKEPRANEPLTGLVRLYIVKNETSKAIEFLQNIINEDPQYLVPYNLLGELAISIKDTELAISSFETAIDINKLWWVPYRGLSVAYASSGNFDESLSSLQRGIQNNANVERLGTELALAQYKVGKRNDAIQTYKHVLEKAPNSILAKNNLSMLLVDEKASQQEINEALTYIDDLGDINDAASLDTVGWVNYRAGNIGKALEFVNRAVALAPDAAELHYHLGMIYLADNNQLKAKEHLTKAVESEQNFIGKNIAASKLEDL